MSNRNVDDVVADKRTARKIVEWAAVEQGLVGEIRDGDGLRRCASLLQSSAEDLECLADEIGDAPAEIRWENGVISVTADAPLIERLMAEGLLFDAGKVADLPEPQYRLFLEAYLKGFNSVPRLMEGRDCMQDLLAGQIEVNGDLARLVGELDQGLIAFSEDSEGRWSVWVWPDAETLVEDLGPDIPHPIIFAFVDGELTPHHFMPADGMTPEVIHDLAALLLEEATTTQPSSTVAAHFEVGENDSGTWEVRSGRTGELIASCPDQAQAERVAVALTVLRKSSSGRTGDGEEGVK